MIIQDKQLPPFNTLIADLKSGFSDHSVYTFGFEAQESIIVRKSAFVGVQLTLREDEIMVDACYPNVFVSSLMSALTASTIFPFNSWINFEKKVADFLKKRYSK